MSNMVPVARSATFQRVAVASASGHGLRCLVSLLSASG
jgi:hypothetical protein